MKYIIRRFILAILTTPFVFAVYVLGYFAISMMTPYESGNLYTALSNLPAVAFAWIMGLTFYTQLRGAIGW